MLNKLRIALADVMTSQEVELVNVSCRLFPEDWHNPDGGGPNGSKPLPEIISRNAILLPTYNEDPYRIMARLRAMIEAIEECGDASKFDWFILSDSTDPSVWIAEEKCFLALRRDLGSGNVFYRHRPRNVARSVSSLNAGQLLGIASMFAQQLRDPFRLSG